MKRFIIPALFVVHAKNVLEAEEIAGMMQSAASDRAMQIIDRPTCFLFMDEELPTREVQIQPDQELPHTNKTLS